MDPERVKIHPSWKKYLLEEFEKDYMKELRSFLVKEANKGKTIYPKGEDIFSAFNMTPFEDVKLVIIGQDPYHGPGQAHGMCFSVRPGVKTPPSLQNIYKELCSDIGFKIPDHGYLIDWAKQGVLLLNSVLTVERSKAASHRDKGWEMFTDKVIEALNNYKSNLVFLLWGSPAQKKGAKIDKSKHLVLRAPHPSPLSAYRGFFGSKHFSAANTYLAKQGKPTIDWQISSSI